MATHLKPISLKANRWIALIVLPFVLSCADFDHSDSARAGSLRFEPPKTSIWSGAEVPNRAFIGNSNWDTLQTFEVASVRDSLFPNLIRVTDNHLLVGERGGRHLRAFLHDGRRAWQVDLDSGFALVDVIPRDSMHGAIIVDSGDTRVAMAVSFESGATRSLLLSTRDARASSFAQLGGDSLLSLEHESTNPVQLRTSRGTSKIEFPWKDFDQLDELSRQMIWTFDWQNHVMVVGFFFGNGWFAYQDLQPLPFVGQYAEHIPFPAIRVESGSRLERRRLSRATYTALDAAIVDGELSVLFMGVTADRGRLIDEFDVCTGEYRRTHLLPGPVKSLARKGNNYFVLSQRRPTRLLVLRPRTPNFATPKQELRRNTSASFKC